MHEAVQELDFDIVFVTSQKFDPELAPLPVGVKIYDAADKENLGQSTFALSSVKGSNGIVLDIDRTFTPEQR